ncbi:VQ motif-containing protein 20 [Capsicum annuum]|uniref:VQ motif-containing protein 20 n=1 Tax=Capsicum annuum TaxID=4072 RepID=UPI001FB067FB|nr:VQ motif-containing protein 20 [Capsicum annuum]
MNHMHVTQFYDHAKADQAINNNNNNNISSPLKINKASHLIRKSSSNSLLPSSSSSSSLYNAVAATSIPHQQPRHPVIIYTHSPKVIHTHPRDFMALVQKLTGLSPEDDPSSPSPPLQTMPQHPKSEPINEEEEEEDPISGPEGCLGDILRLDDQENTYHDNNMTNNNINQKCDLVVNDDNECTSVVTDENNGSCSIGDNSSASCYVPPPPIFDLGNINDNKDINSGISNFNYNINNNNTSHNLSDPPSFFDSNLAPFDDPGPITNSSDFFFSDQQFCNYTDSLFFMPSMRSSFSSSSSESIKELPDF